MEKQNSRLRNAYYELKNIRSICGTGMLVALAVAIEQLKVILIPDILEISFAFLALAVMGWMFGPINATLACGIADILMYIARPNGPFNILWTVVAFVPGLIFGLMFYQKPVTLWRTALAKSMETVLVRFGLNPLCMALLYGKSYWYYLGVRTVKNIVLLPVEIAVLYFLMHLTEKPLSEMKSKWK